LSDVVRKASNEALSKMNNPVLAVAFHANQKVFRLSKTYTNPGQQKKPLSQGTRRPWCHPNSSLETACAPGLKSIRPLCSYNGEQPYPLLFQGWIYSLAEIQVNTRGPIQRLNSPVSTNHRLSG